MTAGKTQQLVSQTRPIFQKLLQRGVCGRKLKSCSWIHTKKMDAANTCGETFEYFGYGSNLLASRIRMQNPSAVFNTVARLDDYCLEFYNGSMTECSWRGASATVTESLAEHVWGVVWSLKKSDLDNLDDQEGVAQGIYKPIMVTVTAPDGRQIPCRTYYLVKRCCADQRPSPQYLDVIVQGAIQHGLPDDYLNKLRKIEHNGFDGPIPLYDAVMANHCRLALTSN